MELLERDGLLRDLDDRFAEAAAGNGRMVLVAGEAGIGKTSLVRVFAERCGGRAHVLHGACDPLATPRPLGPFLDMLAPGEELAGGSRAEQLAACRALLVRQGGPTVAIIEDVHWADEATLDALRFIGRRLQGMSALVLVTYRDDEVPVGHPVRLVLGDLSGAPGVSRLRVPPLTAAAVASLARATGVDPSSLYESTRGNPFFVTEVIAAGGGVPATVQDAVLTRASRLSPAARAAVQEAAVVGFRFERDQLIGTGLARGLSTSASNTGCCGWTADTWSSGTSSRGRRSCPPSLPPTSPSPAAGSWPRCSSVAIGRRTPAASPTTPKAPARAT